jgi:CDP-diacylglycerol--serine O-phosphatidyltransferase
LFWGSLLVGAGHMLEASPAYMPALLVMVLISCYLLVSEIPMFALKFKQWGWKGNEVRYLFLITSAILLLLFRVKGIALVIAWYIFLSAFTARKS